MTTNEEVLGRPEAAAAIWSLSVAGPQAEEPTALRVRAARIAALRQASLNAVLGASIYYFFSPTIGTVLIAAGGLLLTLAWISPLGAFAAVDRWFRLMVHGLGKLATLFAMGTVLYTVFTPFAVLFRRGRRDRMARVFDRSAETYWTKREQPVAKEASYMRLY